jgi:simple sugar transport system permease protein
MAVGLVIFAKWDPVRCLWASLLFGGVGSLGVALQGQNLSTASVAYLWNAAPYVLTLGIMILTSSRARALAGAPAELSLAR